MRYLGRKAYHLMGGLGLLSLYFILGRNTALVLYMVMTGVTLVFEVLRLKNPAVNAYIYSHFGSFIRKNEERKLTGTVHYLMGVGLSLYAYSADIAAAAVCYLALGDVAATTAGERFGRTKLGDKSAEGTAAFLAAALAGGFVLSLLLPGLSAKVLVVGAVAAAVIELMPLPVNDNFAIPIVSGAVMELARRYGW